MFESSPAANGHTRPLPSWAALLQRFYEPTGLSVPPLQELKVAQLPQPYRNLLVHSSDMTSTLAGYYGQKPRLRVLSRESQKDSYKREVVLWVSKEERPVEYGIIRIHLDRLPPGGRRLVLQEERPLGDILNGEGIPYLSWPQAFFRLRADPHTGTALGLHRPSLLYGRRNVLLDGSRRLIAEVIEVLAPAARPRMAAILRNHDVPNGSTTRRSAYINNHGLKGAWIT